MTDLTTLTDDQIRVKAAEAMGWKISESPWSHHGVEPGRTQSQKLPDPRHDLNDAVALAVHLQMHFSIHLTVGGTASAEVERYGDAEIYSADDSSEKPEVERIARALTLAVLTAKEAEKRDA